MTDAANLRVRVTAETQQAERRLQAFEQSLQKSARQAQLSAAQVDRIKTALGGAAGASQMSAREFDQLAASAARAAAASGDLASAVTISEARLANAAQGTVQYNRAAADLATYQRRAERGAQTLGQQLKSAMSGAASSMLAAAGAAMGLGAALSKAWEGVQIAAKIDQNRRALGVLLGDMDKGNATFERAIAWGKQYGYTQEEIAAATSSAARIMRKTGSDIESVLSVLARLQAISPEQGLEGAIIALNELASGDTQSIVERFEIPRKEANAMKAEILKTGDAVGVLDRALREMNAGDELLQARMEGPQADLNRMAQASEDLKLSLASLAINAGVPAMLADMASSIKEAGDMLGYLKSGGAEVNAAFISQTTSFKAYSDAVTQFNDRLPWYVASTDALTASQYQYVQSLVAAGVPMDRAIAQAQLAAPYFAQFDQQLRDLSDTFTELPTRMQMPPETVVQWQALESQALALAEGSSYAASQVEVLLADFQRTGDIEAFRAGLAGIEAGMINSASATDLATTALLNMQSVLSGLTPATDAQTVATNNLTTAQEEQMLRTIDQQAEQLEMNNIMAATEAILPSVTGGMLTTAEAASQLAGQFGITQSFAESLLGALLRLRQVQTGLAPGSVTGPDNRPDYIKAPSKAEADRSMQRTRDAKEARRAEAEYRESVSSTADKLADKRAELAKVKQGSAEYWRLLTEIAQLEKQQQGQASKGAKSAQTAANKAQRAAESAARDQERMAEQAAREAERYQERLQKARFDAMSDEQKIAELRRQQALAGDEATRLELANQILDLEQKIADAAERQRDAALALQRARFEDSKTRRDELKRAQQARRVLADENASQEQKQAARDALRDIELDQAERQREMDKLKKDAGGMRPDAALSSPSGGAPSAGAGSPADGDRAYALGQQAALVASGVTASGMLLRGTDARRAMMEAARSGVGGGGALVGGTGRQPAESLDQAFRSGVDTIVAALTNSIPGVQVIIDGKEISSVVSRQLRSARQDSLSAGTGQGV